MTVPSTIEGLDEAGKVKEVSMITRDKLSGPLVFTEARRQFDTALRPLLNDDFGVNMNQNVSFSGNADKVTNGGDTTEWTFSNISGTKASEKDDERAHGAVITVVDYTAIGGATVTVGVDGSDTTITEGVDWNAVTSNDVSATALAVELSTITGVTATADAAVVTIVADAGVNISKLNTNDGTNLPGTGKGIKIDNMAVGNVFQFDKGGDLTVANFTAFSGFINIDKDWKNNDSIEMYCYDTGTATEVSARIKLENIISFGDFDIWQSFVIPFSALGLTSATFDAVRFEQIAKDGAKAPKWFLDDFQVEQTGTPLMFTTALNANEVLHVTGLKFSIADTLASTVADGTLLGLCYKKLLGVPELSNGVVLQRVQAREVAFSATLRRLGDFLAAGGRIESPMGDGTETYINIVVDFPEPIVLNGKTRDSLSLTISDDLSGLDLFTCNAIGKLEI